MVQVQKKALQNDRSRNSRERERQSTLRRSSESNRDFLCWSCDHKSRAFFGLLLVWLPPLIIWSENRRLFQA